MKRLSPLLLLLTGCAAPDISTSGLLGSYSGFERRENGTLVQIVASREALGTYRRVMLEDALIYLDLDARGRVRPSDERRLVQMFRKALEAELGAHYEFVGDIAALEEDVMRIRPAIADVQPGDAEGEVPQLGSATVEIEALDHRGERLAAVVSRKYSATVGATREERFAEGERLFAEWAVEVRLWLDDVTGR